MAKIKRGKTFKQPQMKNDILLGATAIETNGMYNPNNTCALPGKVPKGNIGGVGASANQAVPTRPGDIPPDVAGPRDVLQGEDGAFPTQNTAIGRGVDRTPPGIPESSSVFGTRIKNESRPDKTLGESVHRYPTRPKHRTDVEKFVDKVIDKQLDKVDTLTPAEKRKYESIAVNNKLESLERGRNHKKAVTSRFLAENKVGKITEMPESAQFEHMIAQKAINSKYQNMGISLSSGRIVVDGKSYGDAPQKGETGSESWYDVRDPESERSFKTPATRKEVDTSRFGKQEIGRKTGKKRLGYESKIVRDDISSLPEKKVKLNKDEARLKKSKEALDKFNRKISGDVEKAAGDKRVKDSLRRGLEKNPDPNSPQSRFIQDMELLDRVGGRVYSDIARLKKAEFKKKYPEGYTKLSLTQQKRKAARLKELRNLMPDEIRDDMFPYDFQPHSAAQARPFDELGKMSDKDYKALKNYIKDFEGKSSSVRREKSGDAYEGLLAREKFTPETEGAPEEIDKVMSKSFDQAGYENIMGAETSATAAFKHPEDFGRKAVQDLVYGERFIFDTELRFAEPKDIVKNMVPDIQQFYSLHNGELRLMKSDLKKEITRYTNAYNKKHRTDINPTNFEHDALLVLDSIHKNRNNKLEKVNEVFRKFKKDYGVVAKLAETHGLIPTAFKISKHPFKDGLFVVSDKSGHFLDIVGGEKAQQYKKIVAINSKRRTGRQAADYEVWSAIQAGTRKS